MKLLGDTGTSHLDIVLGSDYLTITLKAHNRKATMNKRQTTRKLQDTKGNTKMKGSNTLGKFKPDIYSKFTMNS